MQVTRARVCQLLKEKEYFMKKDKESEKDELRPEYNRSDFPGELCDSVTTYDEIE